MGAVNQLLASTGLQVSASNPNNNFNNNNLPGSKLMARKRRNEYEDDEEYAGDKYIETNDMDDLEDDDYSMSEGEYQNEEPDVSETNYDDYSSDDTGGYEDDYSSASESIDGELGLRSNEDTTTYQIATESQQNMLNPTSNNMDMYIGTSNLYSDMVGLKPETFRSESMENEFDANDYIGFNPENSILPSVTTDSVVGSFTTDEGIFSTFAPENGNAFVPTLDGVFGFGGGESDESPFAPSVAGAIGLGLGIGLGSALGVPTTLQNNAMSGRNYPPLEIMETCHNAPVPPLREKEESAQKVVQNSIPSEPQTTDEVTTVQQSVSSESSKISVNKPSESKTSKEDGDEDEKEDKKKEQSERMQEHKDEMSEKRISQYERSARELMNKNELSNNQYEAARAAKEHSNHMADLRRQNQLAELQHTVAMRAKDKEMLDIMRNENIDALKYNIEMKNRGQQSVLQNEMMPYSPYQGNDGVIGSGLDDILGVGSNYNYGMDAVGIGMSLNESLGIGSGFGGLGSSLDESLGFVRYDDAPITMNASFMEKLKDKAKRGYNTVKSGTTKAGNVISDVGSTLYNTRTAIINKTNPYRDAYSRALEEKNAIKNRELTAKQALRDKQEEIRNANAMRAQEAREIRQARQLADMQHRIAMEAQRQELAQMRADAYDAQNMRNMMNDVGQALPNQGLSLGVSNEGFGGLSLGVSNSVGGFSGMGLGDSLGLPSVRAQQPVQPQMAVAPTTPNMQYKTEAEKNPYSNSPRLTSSVGDDGYSYSAHGYRSSLLSEVMGEIKPMKKARKSTSKKTKKLNKNKVKRVKKVSKPKTR